MNTRELEPFEKAKKLQTDLLDRAYPLSQMPAKIEMIEGLYLTIFSKDLEHTNLLKTGALFQDIEIPQTCISALQKSVMQKPLMKREALALHVLQTIAPEHAEAYQKFFTFKLRFVDGINVDALNEPTHLSPRLNSAAD